MKKSYASTTYFFPNGKITEKVILALPRGKMGCTWGKKKIFTRGRKKKIFNELSPAPHFLLNTSLAHALYKKLIKK